MILWASYATGAGAMDINPVGQRYPDRHAPDPAMRKSWLK